MGFRMRHQKEFSQLVTSLPCHVYCCVIIDKKIQFNNAGDTNCKISRNSALPDQDLSVLLDHLLFNQCSMYATECATSARSNGESVTCMCVPALYPRSMLLISDLWLGILCSVFLHIPVSFREVFIQNTISSHV